MEQFESIYWVFNNDCTPSTAKTSKTLAKRFLYYNSLNKVTLLCKVSDWCLLFNLKKYKLLTTCYVLLVTCYDVHDDVRDDVRGLLASCAVLLTLWFLSLNKWKQQKQMFVARSSEWQWSTSESFTGQWRLLSTWRAMLELHLSVTKNWVAAQLKWMICVFRSEKLAPQST